MEKNIAGIVLAIPADTSIRAEIRQKVDDFVLLHKILPPVSYQKLQEISGKLINLNKWDEKYEAFAMVCLGNSIWRTVVESIPFNRRILLLPHCLKSSIGCKAEIDQFGLLCQNCQKCIIPDYIDEAEKLGYVVLVTEGTTITTQLIENGKIDAVIGVGCMDVLQKMFDSVQKFSIPGIGIPLLSCGCKDTTVDTEWIKQEVNHIRKNGHFSLLNLNHVKTKAKSIFTAEQLKKYLTTSENEIENIGIQSLLMGGNRYRVILAILTYQAFCKNTDDETLVRLALSVECFHKASLIHDDIEDDDSTRYGKATVHSEHGVALAINTGDLLIGEGYRLIAEAGLMPETAVKAFKILSQGHKGLALGQGTELLSISQNKTLSLNQIFKVFEQKTATAFKVSLLLGATVGGADEISLKMLDKYSHNIGIAYQIMDDITDFKSNNGDIEKRKFSIFISMLVGQVPECDKELIINNLAYDKFANIYKFIEQFKIKQQVENLLFEYISKAKESIENMTNLSLKIALHEILGRMFKDYL